jgi:hypothetical protein
MREVGGKRGREGKTKEALEEAVTRYEISEGGICRAEKIGVE